MVTMTLGQEKIQAGRELLQALDQTAHKPLVAMWALNADLAVWRLLLLLPGLDGPRPAYGAIQRALSTMDPVPLQLEEIVVLRPDSQFLNDLGTFLHTGDGIGDISFVGNVANGRRLPDSHIYRVNLRKARAH